MHRPMKAQNGRTKVRSSVALKVTLTLLLDQNSAYAGAAQGNKGYYVLMTPFGTLD